MYINVPGNLEFVFNGILLSALTNSIKYSSSSSYISILSN